MSEIKASIKSIELEQLNVKNFIEHKEIEPNLGIDITVKKTENIRIQDENEFHVDLEGEFYANFNDFSLNGKYIFELVIVTFDESEAMKKFIEEEKQKIAFPMLSKLSSLVAKITEEFRPFPLVILPDDWIVSESGSHKEN